MFGPMRTMNKTLTREERLAERIDEMSFSMYDKDTWDRMNKEADPALDLSCTTASAECWKLSSRKNQNFQ